MRSDALALMIEEASRWFPLESGGVLLGYTTTESDVVVEVVGPGENAQRTENRFVPDHAHHEEQIDRRFNDTAGAVTYVGDWHSHTHGNGRPSWRDRETLRKIALDADALCPRPLMLILCRANEGSWTSHPVRGLVRRLGPWHALNLEDLAVETFD